MLARGGTAQSRYGRRRTRDDPAGGKRLRSRPRHAKAIVELFRRRRVPIGKTRELLNVNRETFAKRLGDPDVAAAVCGVPDLDVTKGQETLATVISWSMSVSTGRFSRPRRRLPLR